MQATNYHSQCRTWNTRERLFLWGAEQLLVPDRYNIRPKEANTPENHDRNNGSLALYLLLFFKIQKIRGFLKPLRKNNSFSTI